MFPTWGFPLDFPLKQSIDLYHGSGRRLEGHGFPTEAVPDRTSLLRTAPEGPTWAEGMPQEHRRSWFQRNPKIYWNTHTCMKTSIWFTRSDAQIWKLDPGLVTWFHAWIQSNAGCGMTWCSAFFSWWNAWIKGSLKINTIIEIYWDLLRFIEIVAWRKTILPWVWSML